MQPDQFNKMFDRVEYFHNIHMFSYHHKIANLAREEYVRILLEIIKLGGWDMLKEKIFNLEDRNFQLKLLSILTPIDLDFCKNTFEHYSDKRIPEYIDVMPLGWNSFVDPVYLKSARDVVAGINKKFKIGLDKL